MVKSQDSFEREVDMNLTPGYMEKYDLYDFYDFFDFSSSTHKGPPPSSPIPLSLSVK